MTPVVEGERDLRGVAGLVRPLDPQVVAGAHLGRLELRERLPQLVAYRPGDADLVGVRATVVGHGTHSSVSVGSSPPAAAFSAPGSIQSMLGERRTSMTSRPRSRRRVSRP